MGGVWDEGDAVDRILLKEAGAALTAATVVAAVDDATGALVQGIPSSGGAAVRTVRSYADSAATERAVAAQIVAHRLPVLQCDRLDAALSGAEVVLLRLPKSLAALDEIAEAVARSAGPTVQLFAGGKVKHMTRRMNDVLAAHFAQVRASLGQQKARVLMAGHSQPHGAEPGPRQRRHDDLDLIVHAYGGTFAGADVDLGSRSLLGCFERLPRTARTVVDLGCGSGILAVLAARQLPEARILAVDDSRAAVRSTVATAAANHGGDRVTARHADRLETVTPGSVDLVVCNPPFHRGTARDSSPTYAMFADASRVLTPGGELWVVYNSHLPYLNALRRIVGSSSVVAQNPKFTVVRSIKPADPPKRRPSDARA